MKIKKLVVDTAAFVKNVPLWEHGEECFTVPEVIAEIKDRQTKNLINSLPIELQFRVPSPTSIKFIIDFTKKTGDYASLSLADIKVLALTYELEVESKGSNKHLRLEPVKCRTTVNTHKPASDSKTGINIEGFYLPQEIHKDKSTLSNQPLQDDVIDLKYNVNDKDADVKSLKSLEVINDLCQKSEQNDKLTVEHLSVLNIHLSEFSYIGGFYLSNEDFFMKEALYNSFPLMKNVCTISSQLCASGEETFILKLYRSMLEKMSTEKYLLNDLDDCESYRDFKTFINQFLALPHFLRWFLHIQTLASDNILNSPTAGITLMTNPIKLFTNIKDKENKDDSLSTTSSSNIEESMNTLTIDSSELQNDEGFSSNEEYSDVDDEENEDDDEGWITPSNLKSIKNKISPEDVPDDMDTACITADYAMQNTLKHIGLKVMGVDGKLIYNLRTFILRCYACFKTTDKMDLLFCKHCGNKTLKKVSVTMNPDGTQKIWISTKRPINIRGTKFSLPRPRGGKHAINPILVSDQREAQQRTTKLAKMRNDPMHEDYGLGVSPFVLRDVYSRSAQLGITSDSKKIHRGLFYWEQRNPNVAMKKKSGRKK